MKKNSLNLNINKDDSSVNDYLYCWDQFGSRPNKVTIHDNYLAQEFLDVISKLVVESNNFTEIMPDEECDIVNSKVLDKLNENIFLSYVILDKNQPDSIISDVVFLYKEDSDKDEINKILESLTSDCGVDYQESEVNKLNTITLSATGLELERVDVKDTDAIEMYYSFDTMKSINKLIKKIKKSETGISVLYGERGTGKTSIIHYLSTKLDRIVIFVPNNMIEHTINNPDFRRFIKRHSKVLLVLDDCEMSFNEFFVKSNFIVNNLMQLVDGFLSDSIDLSVVTIFNVDDPEEIDHNLLDSNNLIDTVEFKYLSEKEATELSDHLGDKNKYKNKTKLIDIIKRRKTITDKKIGLF